ncbi:MAG TPA: phospholipase D family protein [Pirellulales bacterium]|nr:phospholipase D family protein [Pirellulales bacterium]
MNRQPYLFAAAVLVAIAFSIGYAAGSGGLSGVGTPAAAPAAREDGISCYFSPRGGCTDAVVAEIEQAQHEIMVQAYSFTSHPIAEALIEAHRRGVKVTIVLDKSELKEHSLADEVAGAGIPTFVDDKHKIAHNKIILIDGRTIITGSFNFTTAAEHSNAENLLILHDRSKLYAAYQQNFEHHLGHSVTFRGEGLGTRNEGKTTRVRF